MIRSPQRSNQMVSEQFDLGSNPLSTTELAELRRMNAQLQSEMKELKILVKEFLKSRGENLDPGGKVAFFSDVLEPSRVQDVRVRSPESTKSLPLPVNSVKLRFRRGNRWSKRCPHLQRSFGRQVKFFSVVRAVIVGGRRFVIDSIKRRGKLPNYHMLFKVKKFDFRSTASCLFSTAFASDVCAKYGVLAKNLLLNLISADLFGYLLMRNVLLNAGSYYVVRWCWDPGGLQLNCDCCMNWQVVAINDITNLYILEFVNVDGKSRWSCEVDWDWIDDSGVLKIRNCFLEIDSVVLVNLGESRGLINQETRTGVTVTFIYGNGSHVPNIYKGGVLEVAELVFDEMTIEIVVLWTGGIAGFVQHSQLEACFGVFSRIRGRLHDMRENAITYLCRLRDCIRVLHMDRSFVYDKGKVYKVFATDVKELKSPLMEKRRACKFFVYVQDYEDNTLKSLMFAVLSSVGNLVLRYMNSKVLWENFDYTSDTFLPDLRMKLNVTIQATWRVKVGRMLMIQLWVSIRGGLNCRALLPNWSCRETSIGHGGVLWQGFN